MRNGKHVYAANISFAVTFSGLWSGCRCQVSAKCLMFFFIYFSSSFSCFFFRTHLTVVGLLISGNWESQMEKKERGLITPRRLFLLYLSTFLNIFLAPKQLEILQKVGKRREVLKTPCQLFFFATQYCLSLKKEMLRRPALSLNPDIAEHFQEN